MRREDSEESEFFNELVEEGDDLSVVGAASCFIRGDLNCVLGFSDVILPLYSLYYYV